MEHGMEFEAVVLGVEAQEKVPENLWIAGVDVFLSGTLKQVSR